MSTISECQREIQKVEIAIVRKEAELDELRAKMKRLEADQLQMVMQMPEDGDGGS